MDDIMDIFEDYANFDQLDILEDLLDSGRYHFYIEVDELHELEKEYLNEKSLTKDRADEIIKYLRENKIQEDLDKAFNTRFL